MLVFIFGGMTASAASPDHQPRVWGRGLLTSEGKSGEGRNLNAGSY